MRVEILFMKQNGILPARILIATPTFAPPLLKTLIQELGAQLKRALFILAGLFAMPACVMAQPLPITPPADYDAGSIYPAGT